MVSGEVAGDFSHRKGHGGRRGTGAGEFRRQHHQCLEHAGELNASFSQSSRVRKGVRPRTPFFFCLKCYQLPPPPPPPPPPTPPLLLEEEDNVEPELLLKLFKLSPKEAALK